MKKCHFRMFILILTIAMCISTCAFAETEIDSARASSYLSNYGAYCYAAGSGDVAIYFNVSGNGTQNYLGCSNIYLRQSSDGGNTWSTVYTFHYNNYAPMMKTNCPYMNGDVTYYSCTPGYQYYAIIDFWGGSSLSVGDSRSYGTSIITAK